LENLPLIGARLNFQANNWKLPKEEENHSLLVFFLKHGKHVFVYLIKKQLENN